MTIELTKDQAEAAMTAIGRQDGRADMTEHMRTAYWALARAVDKTKADDRRPSFVSSVPETYSPTCRLAYSCGELYQWHESPVVGKHGVWVLVRGLSL